MLRDSSEHSRADFLPLMERKDDVGPTVAGKDLVGATFAHHAPSDSQERGEYDGRLRRPPDRHGYAANETVVSVEASSSPDSI